MLSIGCLQTKTRSAHPPYRGLPESRKNPAPARKLNRARHHWRKRRPIVHLEKWRAAFERSSSRGPRVPELKSERESLRLSWAPCFVASKPRLLPLTLRRQF